MMNISNIRFAAGLFCVVTMAVARAARAHDWNAYAIVPAGAPDMAMEAVGSGTTDGTVVSIGKPAPGPNQKWVIPRHAPDKGLDDFGGDNTAGARQDLWELRPGDPHLQWIIRPLAGSPLPAASSEGQASAYVAPEIKPQDVLPGQIKKCQFNDSKIFPGTVRDVTVFIPAQYDGSKPACVYVKTDGYSANEKPLLEEMIATKEMPVTIGVFVRPGDLPAPMKGTLGRRNRDFEYDGVSDNNVRFLNDELLPFVAKQFELKLSTSGNDRCISGGSSGGIAAFTAAWQRPDAFSRVYAASGSFVAFRGGNEYPTLVRKTEAKPIRAFLTTGTHDMENCAGDWFLLDQEMDKALKFSGYDYIFRIINGGHVAGYMDNYREAMAYLWKGWPQPVQAGPSAPRVQDVIVPNETWQLAAEGLHDARGPASNAKGEVFFVEAADQKIDRLDLDGHVQRFVANVGTANSLTVGPQGEVYSVSTGAGEIKRYDSAGNVSVIAEGIHGQYLLAMPDGGLYVTALADKPAGTGAVYFLKNGKQTRVASGPAFPTGLAYRPDQWLLAVADGISKWVYSYQINPDGTLSNKERFFCLQVPDWEDNAAPESVCYAREGQMFVATNMGIQICADDGPTQVILPLPGNDRPIGLCLAGSERDTLFAFTGDKIYKRKVKTHGLGAFDPWTKVNGTKL
jgi:enterochelin esterase-like enzyme/sugar lactone lactonase YvrE